MQKFWTCTSQEKGCSWIYYALISTDTIKYYIRFGLAYLWNSSEQRISSLEVILRFIQNATSAIKTFQFSFLTSSIRTFSAEYLQSSRGQWKWSISFLLQPHESGDGQFRRGCSFPVLILTGVKYYCRGKTMPPSELMEGTLHQLKSMDLDCSSSVFSVRFNFLYLKPSSFVSALLLHSFLTLVFLFPNRLWFWKLRRAYF